MKKSITTIATAMLLLFTLNAYAANNNNNNSPARFMETTHLVNSYLAATVYGVTTYGKSLFTADFLFTNTATGKKYQRTAYSSFLVANKGLIYNCSTSYDILDESEFVCMAKATMKFKDFTREDYITLTKSNEGWKVSQVISSYL